MAETVGTKTEQKTSAGKDVYKTPEGESVSEKSVTIKFGDGAYVNAPSIHEGKQYTEDEIKKMLLEGVIKPTSRHDTLEEAVKAAETRSDNLLKDGGMALAKQMEMFDDGGLMDEGGTVDPVSGNDVPPGSTQEEVRDDIPAQLSEGEFVFPADVVRYFGLEKLMEMRQEAKMGLQRMEDMGQMGNSEEAIMPDNLPFTLDDLEMEEDQSDLNFNLGGVVPMQGTGVVNTANAGPTTGFTPYVAPAIPGFTGPQLQNTQYTTATQTTNLPTFLQTVGTKPGEYDELRRYVNDAGQVRQIPFKNGQPIYPIPEGYRFEAEDTTQVTAPTTGPVANVGQQQDGGGGDDGSNSISNIGSGVSSVSNLDTIGGRPTSDSFVDAILDSRAATDAKHENAFGGHAVFGYNNEAMRAATFEQAKQQALSLSLGNQMASTFGLTTASPMEISTAGQQAKEAALAAMAMGNVTQLGTPAQATMYGKVQSAAHNAAKKGLDVNKAIQAEIANHSAAMRSGLISAAARYGNLKEIGITSIADLDKPGVMAQVAEVARSTARTLQGQADQIGKSGAVKDSKGNAVRTRDIDTGKLKGNVMTASALARQRALEKEAKAANAAAAAAAQAAAAQEIAANAEMDVTAADIGVGSTGGAPTSGQAPAGSPPSGMSPGMANAIGGGAEAGGNPGGGYGSDSGGVGGAGDMGVICLTEDMKVKRNGVIDFVTKVQVGDIIDNTVVTEVLHKHMREGYYKVNGELKITNDHPVLVNGAWKRTEDLVLGDYINNVEVTSLEYVEQVTPTVYIGTTDDRYDVYTEGEVYTVHGQYKNALKKAA